MSITTFSSRPDSDLLQRLRSLATAAAKVDGHPPFNDQTWAALRAGDHGVHGFLVPDGEGLAAAAVLTDMADAEDAPAAARGALVELVVAPEHRRQGLGSTLLSSALDSLGDDAAVRAWSHGGHPGAAALALKHGLKAVRELWVMGLDATDVSKLDAPRLPRDVSVRSFEVGHDEQQWLSVNAAAFDFHPEQGKMTLVDLQAREAEEWFDPQGFFLAHAADGALLGFHWTKVTATSDGVPDEGEVYAVGIAPDAQGSGLGRALTVTGLRYLAAKVKRIVLYVEADNTPAVHLYRSLGFDLVDSDVLYAR